MPVTELNMLELEFLRINNFNIYVSLEELQQYGNQLLMHSIREQYKKEYKQVKMQHDHYYLSGWKHKIQVEDVQQF